MKKLLLFLAFFGLVSASEAQDQLYKKDNSKLLVKITEVSPEEIKYKLFDNLTGPTYVVSKSEVSLLIYENGQHEVISTGPEVVVPARVVPAGPYQRLPLAMTKADSLKFYKYSESISLNFLSFVNMEVGLIYQKDFLKSNFNITIPVAIGIEKPSLTESVYFNNGNNGITLNRKLFEVGFGFNYYPSLRYPVNFYVGPSIRYMQYSCQQYYSYSVPSNQPYPNNYYTTTNLNKNGTLSRYCVSVTNGFIFRTRSRLMINMFGSIGFKNDVVDTKIVDPVTNRTIKPINNPVNLYFWTGFALGFCF